MKLGILCGLLAVAALQLVWGQDLDIRFRSKGEPPSNLQYFLHDNYGYDIDEIIDKDNQVVIDFRPSQKVDQSRGLEDLPGTLPFRKTPFLAQPEVDDELNHDSSGLSIVVDDRTFDILGQAVNKNVGRIVKSAAKDWRTVVDGAAQFMGSSLHKTLAPKQKKHPEKGHFLDFLGLSSSNSVSGNTGIGKYPTTTPSPIYASTPSIPPAITPVYHQVSSISPSYGAPQSPPISSSVLSSFHTNFNDVRENQVGPSIQSMQQQHQPLSNNLNEENSSNQHQTKPNVYRPLSAVNLPTLTTTSSTPLKNPFLHSTTLPPSSSTKNPFSDPIYRPKRGPKKKRPGASSTQRPFFQSTTVKPFMSSSPSPSKSPSVQLKQKDRDFRMVKAAFLNFYHKAKDYSRKYRENVDTRAFKQEAGNHQVKPRLKKNDFVSPSIRPAGPTPGPFGISSGKTRLQKPFMKRPKPTKVPPLFTLSRSQSRPPPPVLDFNLKGMRRKSTKEIMENIDSLHAPRTTKEMTYDGILTPPSQVDNEKSYTYYDEDYYFYNDNSRM